MLRRNTAILDREDVQVVRRTYTERYQIEFDVDAFIAHLEREAIIETVGAGVRFRYGYFYYYFAARFIRDHITDATAQQVLSEISRNVTLSDNASVLLFVAYLCRDPLVLDVVIGAAGELFASAREATIREDVRFLAALPAYRDKVDVAELEEATDRQRFYSRMGEVAEAWRGTRDAISEELHDEAAQGQAAVLYVDGALRTIEILGEVLKSYPGSVDGATKVLVISACYSLGRRIIGALLPALEGDWEVLSARTVEMVRRRKSQLDESATREYALRIMIGSTEGVIINVIQSVARAVGSKELDIPLARVVQLHDSVATKLFDVAVSLGSGRPFPIAKVQRLGRDLRNDFVPLSLLRQLVLFRLTIVTEDLSVRQAAFAAVGLTYSNLAEFQAKARLAGGAIG